MPKKKLGSYVLCVALALTFMFSACGGAPGISSETTSTEPVAKTRIVLDSSGNAVEIPATVDRGGPIISAMAQITEMLTQGGGKVSATAHTDLSDYFKKVFPDYVTSNPSGYNASVIEDLIASGTQVVYGPASRFSDDQKSQMRAAGITLVPINNLGSVDDMCQVFTIIGSIYGVEERAAEFVTYYKGNMEKSATLSAPIADKMDLLVLRFSGGIYSTINGTDICHEYITAAGGNNVAKDYAGQAAGTGLSLDTELIIAWNPEIIIAYNQTAYDAIMSDIALAGVNAVKNGKVFICPNGIFGWSTRSGEGAMMPLWLGKMMYPEQFSEIDMDLIVKDFFKTWYGYDIPADELAATLAGSQN